jgi:hypothetical protein
MRTHVHNMVSYFNDIGIVFNDEYRVPSITQLLQKFIQTMHIARVESHAGFVEHVHHVHEAAAQVLDDLHALRFAAGERVRFTVECEIFETDVYEILQTLDQCFQKAKKAPLALASEQRTA